MVDSTILIDYFRKTDKEKSKLLSHFRKHDRLYILSVMEFEIINSATQAHLQFWDGMLASFCIAIYFGKCQKVLG